DLALDADPDRGGAGRGHADPETIRGQVEVDAPVAAVADVEVEPIQLHRQAGGEPEHVLAGLEPGGGALGQVDRAGRGAQVDALGGGAALDVVEVGGQRLGEEPPGTGPVRAGQDPGGHHPGQGRAVRGALQVVVVVA